jgi:hypothetical protein
MRTFICGEVLQIDHHGEVVARLGSHDIFAVLAVQHLLGAVLDKVLIASYLDRKLDLRLGFRG